MKRIILISTLILLAHSARAATPPRHSAGVTVSGLYELFSHAYLYRGIGVEATYRYAFVQNRWCEVLVTGTLHYTATRYSATSFPTDDYRDGLEVGLTVGVLWDIALVKDYFSVYLGGFIGPMYTPQMPARQGGTLNFSDNICVGFHIKLHKALNLNLRYTFRHMSNAGFAKPNHGLNDHCLGVGLFYKF